MDNDLTLKCPKCGSTHLRAATRVHGGADITKWWCGDCNEDLTIKEILEAAEPNTEVVT